MDEHIINWDVIEETRLFLEGEGRDDLWDEVEELMDLEQKMEDDAELLNETVAKYDEWLDELFAFVKERQETLLQMGPGTMTRFEQELIAKCWKLRDLRKIGDVYKGK